MRRVLNITNILFVAIIGLELLLPAKRSSEIIYTQELIGIIIGIELLYSLNMIYKKDEKKRQSLGDITALVYGCILIWELLTTKLDILHNLLFPMPGEVVAVFLSEIPTLLDGLSSSLYLLTIGYTLALVTAIPLALIIGWRKRLFLAVNPLTKVLGPIPPIVYIPYAIAILPTFKSASIFIIFIGAFWPIFINTLNGTFNIDKRIIDSAKVLNVKEHTMLFKIILPGVLPSIISGTTVGLVLSFILLTSAEMIGASSGLGWYVKYFSDFADYPRVVVGIIFIGMVVTGITYCFDKIESQLLKWKN
ncbi:ABC transporter permease [Marinisporobacter balticus]|uniref:NitT/TauT family transport system permease protein n=1 Tax=Marinisporobacter balticus TaxID=2018667 RepID=A0A4R2KJT6_9FIRM|nr:ABC transporter permease subunit [Marinisporobacter balticus]TCO72697.1 NitT/TauT family transport system permease protein [Marinisporobacter balticus]